MKKNIAIVSAALSLLILMAFGFLNERNTVPALEEVSGIETVAFNNEAFYNDLINNFSTLNKPDLFYNVDSRFATTITKEKLQKAKSISDILPAKATQAREAYQNVSVTILHSDGEITEVGQSEKLNPAQIKLLRSIDYSTDIRITSRCKRRNSFSGQLLRDSIAYYLTIVPEKEATYATGHEALIKYLKENSKEKATEISMDQLQPGKVAFTITKDAAIANVKLISTSGYPEVDEVLLELIANIPGGWKAATNSKGKKVDQQLIFFFGSEGC